MIPEPAIAIVLREVLLGLQDIHVEGKIHRDIKGIFSLKCLFFSKVVGSRSPCIHLCLDAKLPTSFSLLMRR